MDKELWLEIKKLAIIFTLILSIVVIWSTRSEIYDSFSKSYIHVTDKIQNKVRSILGLGNKPLLHYGCYTRESESFLKQCMISSDAISEGDIDKAYNACRYKGVKLGICQKKYY